MNNHPEINPAVPDEPIPRPERHEPKPPDFPMPEPERPLPAPSEPEYPMPPHEPTRPASPTPRPIAASRRKGFLFQRSEKEV